MAHQATFVQESTNIQTVLTDDIVLTAVIDGVSASAKRTVETVQITLRDGKKPISGNHDERPLTLSGKIKCSTPTELRTKMDALKRDVAGKGYLDVLLVGWASVRRYNVEVINWGSSDESYTINWTPFVLTLMAYDSPFGENISSSSIYDILNTASNISQTSVLEGSAEPSVDMQLTIPSAGTLSAIEVQNTTTNTAMEIVQSFATNDVVQIKSTDDYVGINGLPVKFNGNVVKFDPGSNDWRIGFRTTDSFLVEVEQRSQNSEKFAFGTVFLAQSFTPVNTTIVARVDLLLTKLGNPPNPKLAIYSNTGDLPGVPGFLVSEKTITSPISGSASYVPVEFDTTVELTAGQKYHLVLYVGDGTVAGGGDINNGIYWKGSTNNPYADNQASKKTGGGAWANDANYDHAFRVFRWQVGDLFGDVSDNYTTETFDTTTFKDTTNTTAIWNGDGKLGINGINNELLVARSLSYASLTRLVPAEFNITSTEAFTSGIYFFDYYLRANTTAAFKLLTRGVWTALTAADIAGILDSQLQFRVDMFYKSGEIPQINDLTIGARRAAITDGADQLAQSFTVGASGYSVGSLELMLKKLGTISNFTVEIQSDSADAPSGTAITDGSATVEAANVPTSFSYVSATFASAPALSANTKYWVVVKPTGAFGADNYLLWRATPNSSYTGGKFMYKIGASAFSDSGATGHDLVFRTKKGSGTTFGVDVSVSYKPRWQ